MGFAVSLHVQHLSVKPDHKAGRSVGGGVGLLIQNLLELSCTFGGHRMSEHTKLVCQPGLDLCDKQALKGQALGLKTELDLPHDSCPSDKQALGKQAFVLTEELHFSHNLLFL